MSLSRSLALEGMNGPGIDPAHRAMSSVASVSDYAISKDENDRQSYMLAATSGFSKPVQMIDYGGF